MPRSGIKRKSVEALLDCEKLGEIESKIKIESTEIQFLDDASLPVPCCCLCKTSSGDELAIFGNGPKYDPDIANKIQSCSGLENSWDGKLDAQICRRCLNQLDVHYAFQKQALKCSKYAQNQTTEAGTEFDISPEDIRVCRFCLKVGKKLLDMYPGGESPEYDLLKKIRELLAIEVNSQDPVTKICRNCIESIDELFEFRTRHMPTSVCIKDEEMAGPSQLAKIIKQEDEYVSEQDLSASDSDCSSEEYEHNDRTFAGRQKLAAMQPELVQLIGAEVDGKNYAALSEDDGQIKVIFEDQLFRFHSERGNGSSLWSCDNRKLRDCRVKLEIDTTGRCATVSAGARTHTHPPGTAKLMQCPLGKGMTEMNGKAEPFYMFCSSRSINRSITNYTRSLILQGFRYALQQINVRGVKSSWYCVQRRAGGCKVKLMCYGIIHNAELNGQHNHGKLTPRDIETILLQTGINTTSTDAISEFQNVNTAEIIIEPRNPSAKGMKKTERVVEKKSLVKEKDPQIFRLLKQDDVERNFEVIKTGEKLKVVHDGYEYLYFGKLPDKSTIWKCIMDTLRRCPTLSKITPDGKHLEMYEKRHTHGTEEAEIFRYPLGKRMIGEEPLWLLERVSQNNYKRYVVYRDYLFNIANINKKGKVRWTCLKKKCGAVLFTKGNFQEAVLKNEHSHEKPPKSIINLLNGTTASKVDADNFTFKQKLLSYIPTITKIWDEGENEYETLYILTDANKDTPSGFIFRRHKYSFASIDQNGTSKWRCWKRTGSGRGVYCRVSATVEGIFEAIAVAKHHAHEMISDSMMEQIKSSIEEYASLPNSSEGKTLNLEEKPDHKRPTGNILSILARHDPERNFILARAKAKLLVNYEGEDYRLKSRDAEGISKWCCVWLQMRKCPVNLRMSADGKQVAYSEPRKQHNHADEIIGVFLQAPGKGLIYDKVNNMFSSYWLFSYQSEFRSNKGIIYKGNKYKLCSIANDGASVWTCRNLCKMFVKVEGTFKKIFAKHEHNHARLTDDEIKDITGQEDVDKDLLPDCEHSNADVQTS